MRANFNLISLPSLLLSISLENNSDMVLVQVSGRAEWTFITSHSHLIPAPPPRGPVGIY